MITIKNIPINSKYLFFLSILITFFFCFYNLNEFPLEEWDEARNGINAIEMIQNGDWMNLHYAGEIDNWSFKPPLFIWIIALSFKAFGYSAFALRLPSAIFTLFTFIILYRLIKIDHSDLFATLTCLILLSVKGIVGFHVGRTGDFDAMLLFFLLLGIWEFWQYEKTQRSIHIIGLSVAWGVAFWVKGPAALVFLPALLLYLILKGTWQNWLTNRTTYLAIFLWLGMAGSWFGLMFFKDNTAGTQILVNDLLTRFTDTEFEKQNHISQLGFFINYLDACYNVWNYVFYVVVIIALIRLKIVFKSLQQRPLQLLAICIWASLGLFLSLAATTHRWYFAPALPFVVITTVGGILYASKKWKWIPYIVVGLLLFTISRRFCEIATPPVQPIFISKNCESIKMANKVIQLGYLPPQNRLLYFYFCNQNIFFGKDENWQEVVNKKDVLLVFEEFYQKNKAQLANYQFIDREGGYLLMEVK